MPSRFEISDELWAEVEPLIPVGKRRRRYPGRKAIDDRLTLNGILHVLHTGIAVGGSAARVRLWVRGDVLAAAAELAAGRGVGRAAPATAQKTQRRREDRLVTRRGGRQPYPCPFGGLLTGASPVDRGRAGSKHHLLVDASGIPLAVTLTGGNRNDVTQLIPRSNCCAPGRSQASPGALVASPPASSRPRLRPRQVPPAAPRPRVKPVIARRGTENGSGLGTQRWVLERGFAHVHNFRRLRTRYERGPAIHTAFLTLARAILYHRRLRSF